MSMRRAVHSIVRTAGVMDRNLINVIQLGFGFLLIFLAFNGSSFIEEIVLSASANTTHVDKNAGYHSLSIIYFVFTFSNFLAPPVVAMVGAKWSMVLGGLCYLGFMVSFLKVTSVGLYITSAILGFGAALIWTGQGNYLTLNSNSETIGRNSGILWAMLQCCLVFGGIFLYVEFQSTTVITQATTLVIYSVFSVMTGLGIVVFALLRKPAAENDDLQQLVGDNDDELVESVSAINPEVIDSVSSIPLETDIRGPTVGAEGAWKKCLKNFLTAFHLLKSKNMILLAIVFSYSGIELTFWSGLYPTWLGRINKFTTSKNELVALNAIFIGIGQILGGGSFGLFGHRTNVYGRNPIIILGTLVHLLCFFLVFLNIPLDASVVGTEGTDETAYLHPNQYLALICSFLVGLGDSCWNTQCYSILGSLYAEDSAPAFALFKFFQSLFAAGAFYYGSAMLIHWQLLILCVTCFMAALSFFPVEFYSQSRTNAISKLA